MTAAGPLLLSTFVLAACSRAINYTYSKKNFYESDVRGRSFRMQTTQFIRQQLDNSMVRECMKAKG